MDILKQLTKRIFQYEARLVLKKYKPKILAISGSVGKTTTKDALYTVLSGKKFFVRKTEKSFTSELGIPLAIIGCTQGTGSLSQWFKNIISGLRVLFFRVEYPDWLIVEIDSDKPGDISNVSHWLRPDIIVLTEIGEVPAHVESFGDTEKSLSEKKHLIDNLSRDGVVIYNNDDNSVKSLVYEINQKTISCGISPDSDLRSSNFTILYGGQKTDMNPRGVPTGMSFEIMKDTEKYTLSVMGSLGISNVYATLLASATAGEFGISHADSIVLLAKSAVLPGRMNIISGIKDAVIIDDSYNASPVAMKQAIEVLLAIETSGRKIAVLGDMLELGRYSIEEHKKIAHFLYGKVSKVICVGVRSRILVEELLSLGMNELDIFSFDTSREAGVFLQNELQIEDTVLVKGSQMMRMERIVEEIMRHPEDKEKLLVRQESEWRVRD